MPLSVVTFSVINCIALNNLTLYVKTPQVSWLKVSHVMLNEFSAISVIIRFGINGRPIYVQEKNIVTESEHLVLIHYTIQMKLHSRQCKKVYHHISTTTYCYLLKPYP